jgi:hypothetical protein
MRVLVACEYSGRVRDAFTSLGHDAWSCDTLTTESPGNHYVCNVLDVLGLGWDLMIGHPPCTYLCIAGLHYSKKDSERMKLTMKAYDFFMALYNSSIPKIAIENPVGIVSTLFRKPDQIINPFQFGEPERKKTCLWLKGLPKLIPETNLEVKPRKTILRKSGVKKGQPYNYYWRQGKSAHERSRTFQGIANAMARQWGMERQETFDDFVSW